MYRARRSATPVPVVALVGYTNAGKSTLLNTLTAAGVLAEDKLFATLDPTTRRLRLPGGTEALLSDTVGFIQKLPPQVGCCGGWFFLLFLCFVVVCVCPPGRRFHTLKSHNLTTLQASNHQQTPKKTNQPTAGRRVPRHA